MSVGRRMYILRRVRRTCREGGDRELTNVSPGSFDLSLPSSSSSSSSSPPGKFDPFRKLNLEVQARPHARATSPSALRADVAAARLWKDAATRPTTVPGEGGN